MSKHLQQLCFSCKQVLHSNFTSLIWPYRPFCGEVAVQNLKVVSQLFPTQFNRKSMLFCNDLVSWWNVASHLSQSHLRFEPWMPIRSCYKNCGASGCLRKFYPSETSNEPSELLRRLRMGEDDLPVNPSMSPASHAPRNLQDRAFSQGHGIAMWHHCDHTPYAGEGFVVGSRNMIFAPWNSYVIQTKGHFPKRPNLFGAILLLRKGMEVKWIW